MFGTSTCGPIGQICLFGFEKFEMSLVFLDTPILILINQFLQIKFFKLNLKNIYLHEFFVSGV